MTTPSLESCEVSFSHSHFLFCINNPHAYTHGLLHIHTSLPQAWIRHTRLTTHHNPSSPHTHTTLTTLHTPPASPLYHYSNTDHSNKTSSSKVVHYTDHTSGYLHPPLATYFHSLLNPFHSLPDLRRHTYNESFSTTLTFTNTSPQVYPPSDTFPALSVLSHLSPATPVRLSMG